MSRPENRMVDNAGGLSAPVGPGESGGIEKGDAHGRDEFGAGAAGTP